MRVRGGAGPPRGSVASGLMTAGSMAVMTAAAALIAVLIARYFGRGADTDGFFAAYAVYLVLLLAATSIRIVVLPSLARSRAEGGLVAETGGYAVALAAAGLPVLVVTTLFPGWLAGVLTATGEAERTAAEALVWLGPAAVAQLYAGLAASALAALDDYAVAAAGFALGAVLGLATIVALVGEGIVAVSYGLAVNGAVSLGVPVAALAWRARGRRLQAPAPRLRARLLEFAEGVSYPLALQALYLIALRSAGLLGVGSPTSFSYAYLIASSLVAIAASSLALVLTVPVTKRGMGAASAHEHVVHATWLALVPIAGIAGVLALGGEPALRLVLGEAFADEVGAELGRLVVYLSPWMAVSVGVTVTFPLMFVLRRARALPLLAGGAFAFHVGADWAGRMLLGLPGIALALAITTALAFAVQLALLSPRTLARAARGTARASLVVAVVAAGAFALGALPAQGLAAAALGLAAYAAALALLRPGGLRAAWSYVGGLR